MSMATPNDIHSAVAQLENATRYLTSPFMVAQMVEGLQAAVIRANSPWLNRKDAAEYARCSVGEIDRAARAGFIPTHNRGATPLFKRVEIDDAISGGRWKPAGQ